MFFQTMKVTVATEIEERWKSIKREGEEREKGRWTTIAIDSITTSGEEGGPSKNRKHRHRHGHGQGQGQGHGWTNHRKREEEERKEMEMEMDGPAPSLSWEPICLPACLPACLEEQTLILIQRRRTHHLHHHHQNPNYKTK